jgi:hypothetical protein
MRTCSPYLVKVTAMRSDSGCSSAFTHGITCACQAARVSVSVCDSALVVWPTHTHTPHRGGGEERRYQGVVDHGEVLEEDHVRMHVVARIGGRIVLV